jgi:hypothetical protein
MSDHPWSLHPHRNGWHHIQAQVCHLPCHSVSCLTEDEHRPGDFFVFPDANEEMKDMEYDMEDAEDEMEDAEDEMEDAEDEMEMDEDIHETAGLEEEVLSDDEEDNSQ